MRASLACTRIIEDAATSRASTLAAGEVAKMPVLVVSSPMPWDFWLIFFLLGFVIPWRGYARMRHLMTLPEVSSRERIKMYLATIFFQWALTALVLWRALARGLSPHELGIVLTWSFPLLATTLVGAALISAAHWANVRRMARSEHANLQRLRALGARLFPRSRAEFALFVLLSFTAGICEEFLFRGFVMAALVRAGLATWLVVFLSSAMFGLAHLYQGKGGSLGTGILGTLFALARITFRTLLPVVVWHSALDIVAGVAGARFLHGPQQPTAAAPVLNEIHR